MFFNRDERKSRPIADAPREFSHNGVRFLSPRDPKGGGTWMLANEEGFVVCLLNKWDVKFRTGYADEKSRGRLVWTMGAVKSFAEVEQLLDQDLSRYRAFTLVVFSPHNECRWDWDGECLREGAPLMPLTSSSYRYPQVKEARESVFGSGIRGEAFHASEGEVPSAYTVRMCRDNAQTWSRSRVQIGKNITWDYLAEKPDLAGAPERSVVLLSRRCLDWPDRFGRSIRSL